jgi:hypothetical protein
LFALIDEPTLRERRFRFPFDGRTGLTHARSRGTGKQSSCAFEFIGMYAMDTKAEIAVWSQVLASLLDPSSPAQGAGLCQIARHASSSHRRAPTVDEPPGRVNALIRLIELGSPRTATLAWCDPALCHYGDQTWHAGAARRPGICAFSGAPIRRGDLVYRPRISRPSPPLNANAMILARFIDCHRQPESYAPQRKSQAASDCSPS